MEQSQLRSLWIYVFLRQISPAIVRRIMMINHENFHQILGDLRFSNESTWQEETNQLRQYRTTHDHFTGVTGGVQKRPAAQLEHRKKLDPCVGFHREMGVPLLFQESGKCSRLDPSKATWKTWNVNDPCMTVILRMACVTDVMLAQAPILVTTTVWGWFQSICGFI